MFFVEENLPRRLKNYFQKLWEGYLGLENDKCSEIRELLKISEQPENPIIELRQKLEEASRKNLKDDASREELWDLIVTIRGTLKTASRKIKLLKGNSYFEGDLRTKFDGLNLKLNADFERTSGLKYDEITDADLKNAVNELQQNLKAASAESLYLAQAIARRDSNWQENIGIALSGFLAAIAAVCLTSITEKSESDAASAAIGSLASDAATFDTERFAFAVVGLLCLLTAALMIDAILDKRSFGWSYRAFGLLNGGYLLFSIALASISGAIIYSLRQPEVTNSTAVILIIVSSLAFFCKLMIKDDNHTLVPLLLTSYVASFWVGYGNIALHYQLLSYALFYFFLRILGKALFGGSSETSSAT